MLPYSVVGCDAIREALSMVTSAEGFVARQHALGLAMGRVVAHELYHKLTNTTKHATHGLTKAAQSVEDLISPDKVVFEAEDYKAIAAGLKN